MKRIKLVIIIVKLWWKSLKIDESYHNVIANALRNVKLTWRVI